MIAAVDPLGNRTSYAYDKLNRAVQVTDALGRLATVVFDAAGNPGPNRLPAKYDNPQTTDLKVQVKTGPNDFNLDLAK